MSWDAVAASAEAIGAIAVVWSLIYLAIQIRQNTETVKASTELETSKLWTDFHARMAQSADLTRIWDQGFTAPDTLSPDDKRRFIWIVSEYFFLVEGLYRQHVRGFLSGSSWRQHERTVIGVLRNEIVGNWWKSGVSPFSTEFRTHIERAFERGHDDAWTYVRLADL